MSSLGDTGIARGAEARRAMLDQTALAIGEAWARRSRDALCAEGRRATGGWPGTMSEARVCARHHFGSATVRRDIGALSASELERAARAAYARAREVWLSTAEREVELDDGPSGGAS